MEDFLSQEDTQMVYSRKRKYGRKIYTTSKRRRTVSAAKYRVRFSRMRSRGKLARVVRRTVLRMSETKECQREIAQNAQITHNFPLNLNTNALFCSRGTAGEEMGDGAGDNNGTRIGQKIFVQGIKVAIQLEAQQYRPKTTFWLYLVRNKRNKDATLDTKAEMWEGRSTTVPLDYIDTSKVEVAFCKKFVLTMPNMGSTVAMSTTSAQGLGVKDSASGTAFTVSGGEVYTTVTNPQVLKKFYIPINKTIVYGDTNDGGYADIPNSLRYQWVIVGYDNYTTVTNDLIAPLGHVSMTTVMKFKDV